MSEKDLDPFYKEMENIEKRIMLNKLIQLTLLLHTAILNYARFSGIPIAFDANILRLTQEIEKTDIETFRLSDGSYNEAQNRRKLTEPRKQLP